MIEQTLAEEILQPKETKRIWINIIILSIACMTHFTAANGAINLQSSIHAEEGLGTASLAALHVGFLLSNIFITSVVIKWLGTKKAIYSFFISHMPFIVCQLYPRFYTLVPASLLLGLGSGVLWCSSATYLSDAAEAHSSISKIPAGDILSRFLAFFFTLYQSSQIWGNLISSLVISSSNNASVTTVNDTKMPVFCASYFLPSSDAYEALPKQPFEKISILTGAYVMCIIVASIIIWKWLDSMKRYASSRNSTDNSMSAIALLTVTVKQLGDVNQLLLIPISTSVGLSQAFFLADFSTSFVACAIGTGSVGYVMTTYGAASVVGCIVTGFLVKLISRRLIFCSTMVIQVGVLLILLFFHPHTGDYYVMFLIAIFWGLCDAVWITQMYGFYGVQFRGKEVAAYSNLQLWVAFGNIISFALSSYVRTAIKILLVLCVLIVGVMGYLMVEYRNKKRDDTK